MAKEFIRNIDFSKLQPVSSSIIRFSAVQSDRTKKLIQESSLSFLGKDLLDLTRKEILLLSDRLRGRFASIAAEKKTVFDRQDLALLKDSDENSLLHELEHLKAIVVLRPELLDDATINILALLINDKLKMAMNVMTPIPEQDYSSVERAQIMMAPFSPSSQDYVDLYQYLKSGEVEQTEIIEIRELVLSKKETEDRAKMLTFLASLTSYLLQMSSSFSEFGKQNSAGYF